MLKQAGILSVLSPFDALALDLLRSAGILPEPMITFLKRGEAQFGSNPITKAMYENDPIAAYATIPALAGPDCQASRGICGSGP